MSAAIAAGTTLFGSAWTVLSAAGVPGNRNTIFFLLLVSAVLSVAVYVAFLHRRIAPAEKHNVLQRIRDTKVIRVGFFRYPPLIDYDEKANYIEATGLYADVLRDLAAEQSLRIDWCPLKLSEALDAVTHHKVDCYACIMKSDVRNRECEFVGLLHVIAIIGVVRKNENSLKRLSDLGNDRDLKVVVCEGEIGHHMARETLKLPPRQLIEVNAGDISAIASQVRDGHGRVALADSLSCKRMMKGPAGRQLKLVFTNPPMMTVPNGFMIAKNQKDLGDWLDKGVRRSFIAIDGPKSDLALKREFGPLISRLR